MMEPSFATDLGELKGRLTAVETRLSAFEIETRATRDALYARLDLHAKQTQDSFDEVKDLLNATITGLEVNRGQFRTGWWLLGTLGAAGLAIASAGPKVKKLVDTLF